MGYIYKISNSVNDKVYIGQTVNDPEIRWNSHKKNIKDLTINRPLVDAMRVLGVENFRMEVIIICFDESLDDIEIEQIKKFNSLHPHGYNYTEGGHFHKKPSEELRKKLSEVHKKRFESEDTRRKNKEAQIIAFSNPELRLKMATVRASMLSSETGEQWRKGHSKKINAFYETKEGKEAKERMSKKKKEFYGSPEGQEMIKKRKENIKARNLTGEGKASIEKMRETKKTFFATPEGKEMIKKISEKRLETMKKKQSAKSMKIFKCNLCNYNAPNNAKLKRHCESQTHKKKAEERPIELDATQTTITHV